MHQSVWAIVYKTQLEMGKFMSFWVQMLPDLNFILHMSPMPTTWHLCLIKYFGFLNDLSPWLRVYLLEYHLKILWRRGNMINLRDLLITWLKQIWCDFKGMQKISKTKTFLSWLADARNLILWDLFFWMKAFSSLKCKYPQERKYIKLSNI